MNKKVANKVDPLPKSAHNPKKGRVGDTGSLPNTGKKGGYSMGRSTAGKRGM